jgi:Caspase domain
MAVVTRAAGAKRLATLVGCNYFGSQYELHGCINDVKDMTETLVSRFGFNRSDVTVLTDEPESEPKPTGANIKRVLGDMIAKANSGDVLFFHYSGHGTLIPATKPHHGHRKDEAIVPCDFNLITGKIHKALTNSLCMVEHDMIS